MSARLRISGQVQAALLLLAASALAQNPPQSSPVPSAQQQTPEEKVAQLAEEGGADSNPLEVVYLQLRNEYYNLNNGNWTNASIVRSDKVFLRKNRWGGKLGILTRFDLPIITQQIGSVTHSGLGDIYAQSTYVPLLTRRFAFFVGTGLMAPTATYRQLGSGKWTAAPFTGPLYFFGRRQGLAFVKVQDFSSFAGNSKRPDVKYLLVTPTLLWNFTHRDWVLVQEESNTAFTKSGGTWFKAGLQVGHMFNRKFGVWIMPEVLWGEPRPGNFNLKASFVWNR
jgi:hypothetical protein